MMRASREDRNERKRTVDIREKVAAMARPLGGLSFAASTRAAYLELLAPAAQDDAAIRDACGHAWSCYLTTLGLWRRMGVSHPLLSSPYEIGKAAEWVALIGAARGAIRKPDGVAMPSLGDAVAVNGGEHIAAAILSVALAGNVATVDTLEGGQVDGQGNKAIKVYRAKALRYEGRALMLGGSTVYQWYDAAALGIPEDAVEVDEPARPGPAGGGDVS